MCQNDGARGMHPLVSVGVVEVPVSVDEVFDPSRAYTHKGFHHLYALGGQPGVHHQHAVAAGEDCDVSAGVHEKR